MTASGIGSASGHTVIAVPVPALDNVVRERTAFYDESFVSADPGFVHAHITVLAPWVDRPTDDDLAAVARVTEHIDPYEVVLAEVAEFPDGLIHLRPEPETPLRAMTTALAAAFPQHPPYGGRYGDVAPHLTLDRRSADVTPATVRESVRHLLPLMVRVDRIDLQRWANHDCRRMHSWRLGGGA